LFRIRPWRYLPVLLLLELDETGFFEHQHEVLHILERDGLIFG
jgi:hypothetical protein